MIVIKAWILVFAGAGGAASVWGAGAGVAPFMFQNKAACEVVRQAADGAANPRCVFTSLVVPR